jgi:GNAT superfamily N-acetyltransferase
VLSADCVVRVSGGDDVAAIAYLRGLWTAAGEHPEFTERMAAWISSEGDRRTTWLAWVGAEAVGMASLLEYRRMPRPDRPDSRWGYLSNMFVREGFRNRGIGSALLSSIIVTAEERRYARLVLSPSEEALRFYQRAGFIVPDQSARGDRLLVRPRPHSGS